MRRFGKKVVPDAAAGLASVEVEAAAELRRAAEALGAPVPTGAAPEPISGPAGEPIAEGIAEPILESIDAGGLEALAGDTVRSEEAHATPVRRRVRKAPPAAATPAPRRVSPPAASTRQRTRRRDEAGSGQ